MNIGKKVFGLALTLLVATHISSANAQSAQTEDALLFKIHDITPVKNNEGEVIACDFNTTVFNRSAYTLKDAELDLSWKDTTIEGVVEDEKKQDAASNRRTGGRAYSETERSTATDVSTAVSISTLRPQRQVTINSRINTDRCFLLIEDVNFNVKSCNVEGLSARGAGRTTGAAGSPCGRLFKFVSPADPQFYLEFKEISVDEQRAQEKVEREKSISEIDRLYRETLDALESAGSIISSIK